MIAYVKSCKKIMVTIHYYVTILMERTTSVISGQAAPGKTLCQRMPVSCQGGGKMIRIAHNLFGSQALVAAVVTTAAAAEFPSKPVRLVVPFAAGGTFELEARLIAAKLQENWREPIIVESRPGANTILGV